MLTREIIWVALGAIRANVLRSILTTLGIIIGVSGGDRHGGAGRRRTAQRRGSNLANGHQRPDHPG